MPQLVTKKIISSSIIFFAACTAAFAQSPADEFARRQAAQQKKLQIETLRKFTPKDQATNKVNNTILPTNGACFEIDKVLVEGIKTYLQKKFIKSPLFMMVNA